VRLETFNDSDENETPSYAASDGDDDDNDNDEEEEEVDDDDVFEGSGRYFPEILQRDLEGRYRPEVPADWDDLRVDAHLAQLSSASTSEIDAHRFDSFRDSLVTARQCAQKHGLLWDLTSDFMVVNHVFRKPGTVHSYTTLPEAVDLKDAAYAQSLRRVLTAPCSELEDFDRVAQGGSTGLDEPGHVYVRVLRVRVADATRFMICLRRVIDGLPTYMSEHANEVERVLNHARAQGKTHVNLPYFGITTHTLVARDAHDTRDWASRADQDAKDRATGTTFWVCMCAAHSLVGNNSPRLLYSLVGLPLDAPHRFSTESTLEFFFIAPRHPMRLANVALGGRIPHHTVHPELCAAFKLLKNLHADEFRKTWSEREWPRCDR
jgi:hypothetical protein